MKRCDFLIVVNLWLLLCVHANADANTYAVLEQSAKPTPEVTFDRVQAIFGHKLDTQDSRLKTLLLAIGMDHTTPTSPHIDQFVGIPYIVHHGPEYWVGRLADGDHSIEVLVNNALLLLFSQESAHASHGGVKLLQAAADQGYWPASYFIAETTLANQLLDSHRISLRPEPHRAQQTMDRYNHCAAMGFAPCQYRIGFWLVNDPATLTQGITILRQALDITLSDTRYQGVLDQATYNALGLIITKGEQAGLDTLVLSQYRQLLQQLQSQG